MSTTATFSGAGGTGVSVRAKILGSFLLIAVVMAAILLVVLRANREIDRITRRMVEQDVAAVKAIGGMQTALLGQETALSRYLLTGETRWIERRDEEQSRFAEARRRVGAAASLDTERAILDEIDELLPRYEAQVRRALAEFRERGLDASLVNQLRLENNLAPEIYDRCERLLGIHEGILENNQRQADQLAQRNRNLGYATIGLVLAASLALAFLLRAIVLQPIRQLSEGARAYGQGRLNHRVPVQGNDELADLSRTFNEMAAALQKERGRLTEMSITDELTRLKNFRHFASRLEEEVRRADRYGHRLSLVLVDIDHFKAYNDNHGHPAGNEVLRVIGRLLRDNARATDILARFGGEEFAMILPETTKADACSLAEKVRKLIELHSFPGEEYQPGGQLTVSLGVASVPEDSHDSPLLLDAADRALYSAKRNGRNQVVAYEAGMSHPQRLRRASAQR